PDRAIDADLMPAPSPDYLPPVAPPPPAGDVPPVVGAYQPPAAPDVPYDVPPPPPPPVAGVPTTVVPPAARADTSVTYQQDDLIGAAEGVFGKGAQGLAGLIEDLLSKQGEPNGYIIGREGS